MNKGNSFYNDAIEAIEKDLIKRKEELISDVTFVGALFQMKVKNKEGQKRTVTYSAAATVLKGYRKLKLETAKA